MHEQNNQLKSREEGKVMRKQQLKDSTDNVLSQTTEEMSSKKNKISFYKKKKVEPTGAILAVCLIVKMMRVKFCLSHHLTASSWTWIQSLISLT